MQDFLFVKEGGKRFRVLIFGLQYIEADHRFVKLVTANKVYIGSGSLSLVEQQLPPDLFCRIHRSHIVSLQHIRWFTSKSVVIGEKRLSISRQYWSTFSQKVATVCDTTSLTQKNIIDLYNRTNRS